MTIVPYSYHPRLSTRNMNFSQDCPNFLKLQAATYPFAKNLLFKLDAELAHEWTIEGLRRTVQMVPGFTRLSKPWVRCPVEVMGLRFENRLGLAAGLDKGAWAIDGFGSLGFGFIEVGTLTPRPQAGNPRPRLFRLKKHSAIINRMGFNNPGVAEAAPRVKSARFTGIVGVNIGKNKDTPNDQAVEDYVTALREAYPVAGYIAVNLSSPNTAGLRDLQSGTEGRDLLRRLVSERDALAAERKHRVPLAVKIAPDFKSDDIRRLGEMLSELQIDAVIATNTTIDRSLVRASVHADEAGGLSGAPLRERSTAALAILRSALDPGIAIIGSGGVMSGPDAVEKLQAGADLVQIYTGLVYRGPALVREILEHHRF